MNNLLNHRNQRFPSHALVEVRRFKYIPFGSQSAVLLDLSLHGFKVEFTSDFAAKVGRIYWISVPLSPLGIHGPSSLACHAQCRWFDEKRLRIGGIFLNLSPFERAIINQLMESFYDKFQDAS